MRNLLIVAAVSAVSISSATFADDAESWEGFYFGANIGQGSADFDSNFEIDGITAGGQIGYRHAFDNRIVLGVEATGRYSTMEGTEIVTICTTGNGCPYDLDRTVTVNNTFGGELLVEAGVTVNKFLISAVAGPAWRQYEESRFYNYTGASWEDDTYTNRDHLIGVAFGGRVSYQMLDNASLEVEYLQVQVDGAGYESRSGNSYFSGGMDADEGILSIRFNFRR